MYNGSGFRFPSNTQRALIVGRTGSGKTQYGTWLLSKAPFDRQPYFIVDYKTDELLNATDRIREIGLHEAIPKHPGLYIVHPLPHQEEEVERWLWKLWEKGRVGLYVDEGYFLPDKGAFQAILTQGRSRKIPSIVLTQRPVKINRFAISESDFYNIFHLNDRDDRTEVGRFIPRDRIDVNTRLPRYHSAWYDVANDHSLVIEPVPGSDTILDRIDDRLKPGKRRWL